MADFSKDIVIEKSAKVATYRYMLGKLIYDSTPQPLLDKILEKIDKTQFIIAAGSLAEDVYSFETFNEKMKELQANYQEGDDIQSVADGSKILSNDVIAKILQTGGFVLNAVDEAGEEGVKEFMEAMTEEGRVDEDGNIIKSDKPEDDVGVDNLILSTEPPESIKNIIDGNDFSEFTEEIVMKITNDLRDDKVATDLDRQEEEGITTSLEDDDEGGALPYEDGDSILEDESDDDGIDDLDEGEEPADQTPPPAEDATPEEKEMYQEAITKKKQKKAKKRKLAKKLAYINKIKGAVCDKTEKQYMESPFTNVMNHSPSATAAGITAGIYGPVVTATLGPAGLVAVLMGIGVGTLINEFISVPLMSAIAGKFRTDNYNKVISEFTTLNGNSKVKNDKILGGKYIKLVNDILTIKNTADKYQLDDTFLTLFDTIKFGGMGKATKEDIAVKVQELIKSTPKDQVASKIAQLSDEFDNYMKSITDVYVGFGDAFDVIGNMNKSVKRYVVADTKNFDEYVNVFKEYSFYDLSAKLDGILEKIVTSNNIVLQYEKRYATKK